MNKEQLIENIKINNKEQVVNNLNEKLHLSFSSLKEVLNYFEELEKIKNINILDYLENIDIEYGKSKKDNAKRFIEYIREQRRPVMYKSFKELKSSLNGFKGNNIKITYPENLEGNCLFISAEIRNETDVDNLLKNLERNRDKLKRAINIVKKGG